jgi:ribosomal protein L39E
MSEMLSDGGSASASTRLASAPKQLAAVPTQLAPAPTQWVNRWVDIEQSPIISRWVEIAQVAPPLVIRAAEPLVTPRGMVMVIMFVIGTLAIIILLQPSRRNWRSTG